MITGFNTDVRHGDVVFHVQTEDKGTGNPCVESLVYVGGQILARKRSGYRSLLDEDEPLKAVAHLMERQHQALIKAIHAGRLDEKLVAIRGSAPQPPAAEPVVEPTAGNRIEPPTGHEPRGRSEAKHRSDAEEGSEAETGPEAHPSTAPTPMSEPEGRPERSAERSPIRPLPVRSVPRPAKGPPRPAPSDKGSDDRSLDQVILEYLEMESDQERLVLSMQQTDGDVAMGQRSTLLFKTESSLDAVPIGMASITVRLISTVNEPQVLAEGRTDDSGELELTISIPDLTTGTGALIVTAESPLGNAEMRRLI